MLAQGTNLVAYVKGSKVHIYSLSEGMEMVSTIKGESQISAIACSLNDSFILIGTVNGLLYYCNISERKELSMLEDFQEICNLSLKVTSIYIANDIVYVTSESGIIRILSIEITQTPSNSIVVHNSITEDSLGKEGWLEEIESIGETTESFSTHISRATGSHHIFKTVREIKHNTPINSTVVCGQNIYILDMRGRVIVFPSKVVYDNISEILFCNYLFCVDGNTVFAEVGQVFTSVYFAQSKIKQIKTTREGGYFFILTETAIEVMKIEEMGGKKVFSYKVVKEIGDIVVDSQRSLIYAINNGKPSRLDIGYVWIDRKMEDLKIARSTIKEVHREEEEIEEGDEYFDIPSVKAVKDLALPSIRYSSHSALPEKMNVGVFDSDSDDREKIDSDIEDLFNEEAESEGENEVKTIADGHSVLSTSRQHGIKNKMCGSVEICNNGNSSEKLLYWSSECSINVANRLDYTQIEIRIRGQSVEVSILKETGEVELAAASKSIFLLYSDSFLKIYKSSSGLFTEKTLFKKIKVASKIERLVCGNSFFCVVSSYGLLSNLSVYSSKDIVEVYSLVGTIRGLSASGDYLGVIAEEGEGVSVSLFKYENSIMRRISSSYFGRQAVDFCGVSLAGLFVFEVAGMLYLLGIDRIIGLSGSVEGVPISVVGKHIAHFKENENGTISIYPETIQYTPIYRECLLQQELDICTAVENEVAMASSGSYSASNIAHTSNMQSYQRKAEEEENTIYISKRHKQKPNELQEEEQKISKSYSSTSRSEISPMQTPTKKVKHINPFARN